MSKSTPDTTTERPNFEDAIERLEGIVRRMEEERIPLEELVENYESGMKLLTDCRGSIDEARKRVEVITKKFENGKAELAPFEVSE
jgi:exodeoxyribonuclease VII small subunit